MIGKHGSPYLNLSGDVAVILCIHGLTITNTIFKQKDTHMYTSYQNTLGFKSRVDFVIVSADLRPRVLDIQLKRGAELSTNHYLVVSWIRWHGKPLDKPDRPKCVLRVNC